MSAHLDALIADAESALAASRRYLRETEAARRELLAAADAFLADFDDEATRREKAVPMAELVNGGVP